MAARERLPPWHERQRLPNGREVLIRPIHPEDAAPLRAGFGLLQPEEVRQRFLHSLHELSPEMLDRLTRLNPKSEFALVAAEPLPPGEALVGAVARISMHPAVIDPARPAVPGQRPRQDAEFAILVSRYLAGMGLGRYLMTRLVKWARGKKVARVYGDVFEHNLPMLSLAQSLGFERETQQAEQGLVRVSLDLTRPAHPPAATAAAR